MEELETLESTECPECPGPPPEFRLPPPPRPPFLTEGTFCSESPLAELEDCVAIPVSRSSSHFFLLLYLLFDLPFYAARFAICVARR